MRDFKAIKAWEKRHVLTLSIYRATRAFPREEQYGLVSQMRRAASSIPANIAEGCGRDGEPELARFSQISFGSASELEYWLLLARDLGYLPNALYEELAAQTVEVKKMLGAFISAVRGRTYANRLTA